MRAVTVAMRGSSRRRAISPKALAGGRPRGNTSRPAATARGSSLGDDVEPVARLALRAPIAMPARDVHHAGQAPPGARARSAAAARGTRRRAAAGGAARRPAAVRGSAYRSIGQVTATSTGRKSPVTTSARVFAGGGRRGAGSPRAPATVAAYITLSRIPKTRASTASGTGPLERRERRNVDQRIREPDHGEQDEGTGGPCHAASSAIGAPQSTTPTAKLRVRRAAAEPERSHRDPSNPRPRGRRAGGRV